MKRIQFACFAIFFLPCTALLVWAQALATNPVPSATIASIQVTGAYQCPPDQIIAASGLKTGDVVTAQQIQDATNRLAALGIFSSVNFRYVSKGDAINLEFQVREAPTYPVLFDNFPWFTDSEIGDAIRSKVGLFTGKAPQDGAILDEMTEVVEDQLAARKIKGVVSHRFMAAAVGDGMIMQFYLEGVPLRIQSVEFSDSLATDSERLKDRVPDIKGQPYSRYAIEVFENEQVRPAYASKGFLRAKFGPPQPHLIPDATDPNESAVDVSIPIDPGPVYSWKGVSWQGNVALQSSNLDEIINLKPGDVADGMKMEALWQKIELEYGRRGYLDMKLDAVPQFDESAPQVSYRVSISEGAQYRMGELIITGLSVEAEKRLREAWQISPGQVFDDSYYESHLKILAKPNPEIFGNLPVHYNEFGHLLRPNPSYHTVDVLLDFK